MSSGNKIYEIAMDKWNPCWFMTESLMLHALWTMLRQLGSLFSQAIHQRVVQEASYLYDLESATLLKLVGGCNSFF